MFNSVRSSIAQIKHFLQITFHLHHKLFVWNSLLNKVRYLCLKRNVWIYSSNIIVASVVYLSCLAVYLTLISLRIIKIRWLVVILLKRSFYKGCEVSCKFCRMLLLVLGMMMHTVLNSLHWRHLIMLMAVMYRVWNLCSHRIIVWMSRVSFLHRMRQLLCFYLVNWYWIALQSFIVLLSWVCIDN